MDYEALEYWPEGLQSPKELTGVSVSTITYLEPEVGVPSDCQPRTWSSKSPAGIAELNIGIRFEMCVSMRCDIAMW